MSQFFTTEKVTFSGLDFITVKSNALKSRADITVFNPTNESDKNAPLVILLHGVYGSHWAWTAKGKVHETANKLIDQNIITPAIIAMPSDGLYGDGSGYLPHKTTNFESWIINDLIAVIKENYPQFTNGSPIFIAGLSMGGFGALRLGAKYPQKFKAISGLSSITNFNQLKLFLADFEGLEKNVKKEETILDTMIKNKATLPPFRFDCGQNDLLIQHNRQLHKDLVANDINHIYIENEGDHSWPYWEKNIADTLVFFNSFL